MSALRTDLGHAVRSLGRQPLYAGLVVPMMTPGIAYADFRAWRESHRSFRRMGVSAVRGANPSGEETEPRKKGASPKIGGAPVSMEGKTAQ